jgi:hypothetical protein
MASSSIGGTNMGAIFWDAMRRVFWDEHRRPGVLYTGRVYQESQAVVAENGGRWAFSEESQKAMLERGFFKYPTLNIGGHEPEDVVRRRWATAEFRGFSVDFCCPNVIASVNEEYPNGPDSVLVDFATWLSGAIMLHEIMHNHGFEHPDADAELSWDNGSAYGSSLPHVAFVSVLRVGGYGAFVTKRMHLTANELYRL